MIIDIIIGVAAVFSVALLIYKKYREFRYGECSGCSSCTRGESLTGCDGCSKKQSCSHFEDISNNDAFTACDSGSTQEDEPPPEDSEN